MENGGSNLDNNFLGFYYFMRKMIYLFLKVIKFFLILIEFNR